MLILSQSLGAQPILLESRGNSVGGSWLYCVNTQAAPKNAGAQFDFSF